MTDDRPAWARRIAAERKARDWSQRDAVKALRAHASTELPAEDSMIRPWKRWESGQAPNDFYQPIIAAVFGTVTHALFPAPSRRDGEKEILAASGMETLEIVSRLNRSDVDGATLDALRITTDRLCSEYPLIRSTRSCRVASSLSRDGSGCAGLSNCTRRASRLPGIERC